MNKINLVNIQKKLNLKENIINFFNNKKIEDSFELSTKENELIEKAIKKLSDWVNIDEMATKLTESQYYGGVLDFVDYTLNQSKKICRVNIGVFNTDTGKTDEISVLPSIFVDIFTKVTANQIEKHPELEKQYKHSYLKLLKYIEKNKYIEK